MRSWIALLFTAGLLAAAPETVIEIDAAKAAARPIPRTIYGTFLEPIGKSIYGGLWAQVLENPSFEDNLWSAGAIERMIREEPKLRESSASGLPLPWESLDARLGMRFEPRWGDAANSARSLLVIGLPDKEAGVRQRVYLPVHRVLRYQGSLWSRTIAPGAAMEVSLRARNHPENVLARAALAVAGSAWRRYEFELQLPAGSLPPLEPADFVIALRGEGRVLIDQAFLQPSDAVDGMDPEMIEMSRALRTPLVRYGGNFTSGYHWRDGIGPIDKRVSMLNQSWGMPEYNHFGTDEFLRFCQLVHAEPQICLNLGSGTPDEAADWVRYVNAHWGDRKGGLLWELGNELYGTWQIGYPGMDRVAALTKSFSGAVRAADPRARLIATGHDPDLFKDWHATQLALGPDVFNYLSVHLVIGTGRIVRKDADPAFVARSAFALPVGVERQLREMKEQIDGDRQARGRIGLAFTEWLFHGSANSGPHFNNAGGAVIAGGFLNMLMRVSEFTPIADMTGLIEFGGVWKKRGRAYGVPAYWAFRMYSNADASTRVASGVDGPSYDIEEGNTRFPRIKSVPYLDVVAALNDARDRLTIFAVNRDVAADAPARVRLTAFRPTSARAVTLRGESIYQANDEAQPEAVHPVETAVPVSAPDFTYTFPRASVTVLELRR